MSLSKTPFFELRGGAVEMLMLVLKTADLDALQSELQRRFESTPEFFANDAVVIDVRRLQDEHSVPLARLVALLGQLGMRPLGVAARTTQRSWVLPAGLPLVETRDPRAPRTEAAPRSTEKPSTAPPPQAQQAPGEPPDAPRSSPAPHVRTDPVAPAPSVADGPGERPSAPTLVVDKPLRSGQQVYARGDLVVLALVSNGAEVIAEGNIHVYAPLRGRALAGVRGNLGARIFCTCLEPELISIAGIYRTTDTPLASDVLGKPVQIRLDGEKLIIEPLRLT